MRLSSFARAAARSVLRSARTQVCGQRRFTPLRAAHLGSYFCPLALCPLAAPKRAREAHNRLQSRDAASTERSRTTLLTNSGAREAQHASRRSARQALQPHARNQNELEDFGRTDRDLDVMSRPTRTDRTGACFPSARRDRPSGHQPRVRKRESPTARRRRRASLLHASVRDPRTRPELCAAHHAPSPLTQ